MTTIAATLDSQQISAAKTAAGAITEVAKATISDKKFVFFAAFDGTNNDRSAIYKSGNPIDTNVVQLEGQIRQDSIGLCACPSAMGFRYHLATFNVSVWNLVLLKSTHCHSA